MSRLVRVRSAVLHGAQVVAEFVGLRIAPALRIDPGPRRTVEVEVRHRERVVAVHRPDPAVARGGGVHPQHVGAIAAQQALRRQLRDGLRTEVLVAVCGYDDVEDFEFAARGCGRGRPTDVADAAGDLGAGGNLGLHHRRVALNGWAHGVVAVGDVGGSHVDRLYAGPGLTIAITLDARGGVVGAEGRRFGRRGTALRGGGWLVAAVGADLALEPSLQLRRRVGQRRADHLVADIERWCDLRSGRKLASRPDVHQRRSGNDHRSHDAQPPSQTAHAHHHPLDFRLPG